MRCPKCQYISFGSAQRCRNCGYEFSLAEPPRPIDVAIQPGDDAIGPLTDLPLAVFPKTPSEIGPAEIGRAPKDHRRPGEEQGRHTDRVPQTAGLDLPLFTDASTADDAPLVSAAAAPRPPLAVRRGLPAAKPRPEPPERQEAFDIVAAVRSRTDRKSAAERSALEAEATSRRVAGATASLLARAGAAALDLVILGSIDAAVLYFTLRVCGLDLAEAFSLPWVPMAAFLLLLNGGYLVTFTAIGGQTIGKMATSIRVVTGGLSDGRRVSFGTAALRAFAYLASAIPLGLGFAAALFAPDRRALHDRLADTRVVKA